MFRKNDEKLNMPKVNEGIRLGVGVLKILYFLIIVIAIYITTLLLAKWNVLPFLLDIL